MSKRIVVLGATGNTGSRLAANLLAKGNTVVAVARNADKLSALKARGAEIAIGDLQDAAFLAGVFKGADAAYTLLAPNMDPGLKDYLAYQDITGEAIAAAIKSSGIKYVVYLSSQTADLPSGNGPIVSAHRQELRLNQIIGLNVVHLRPTYFLQNLWQFVGMVQQAGFVGSLVNPEIKFAMISTDDIADVATEYLYSLDFQGRQVRDLLGADDYSMNDFTKILGKAIGKPDLGYVPFDAASQLQGMLGAGMGESISKLYVEMNEFVNKGGFAHVKRTAENTTPTTLEQFVTGTLVHAFKATA